MVPQWTRVKGWWPRRHDLQLPADGILHPPGDMYQLAQILRRGLDGAVAPQVHAYACQLHMGQVPLHMDAHPHHLVLVPQKPSRRSHRSAMITALWTAPARRRPPPGRPAPARSPENSRTTGLRPQLAFRGIRSIYGPGTPARRQRTICSGGLLASWGGPSPRTYMAHLRRPRCTLMTPHTWMPRQREMTPSILCRRLRLISRQGILPVHMKSLDFWQIHNI